MKSPAQESEKLFFLPKLKLFLLLLFASWSENEKFPFFLLFAVVAVLPREIWVPFGAAAAAAEEVVLVFGVGGVGVFVAGVLQLFRGSPEEDVEDGGVWLFGLGTRCFSASKASSSSSPSWRDQLTFPSASSPI